MKKISPKKQALISLLLILVTLLVLLFSTTEKEEIETKPFVTSTEDSNSNVTDKESLKTDRPQKAEENNSPFTKGREHTVPLIREPESLPPDMLEQLNSPPPELPEEMIRQLESPPPELPEDLRRQLEAPPQELPDDIKEALKTPPRIIQAE